MSATIHRWLVGLAAVLTGIGGLIAIPGFEPLGIPAVVGIGFAFAGAVATLIATVIRSATDPQGGSNAGSV